MDGKDFGIMALSVLIFVSIIKGVSSELGKKLIGKLFRKEDAKANSVQNSQNINQKNITGSTIVNAANNNNSPVTINHNYLEQKQIEDNVIMHESFNAMLKEIEELKEFPFLMQDAEERYINRTVELNVIFSTGYKSNNGKLLNMSFKVDDRDKCCQFVSINCSVSYKEYSEFVNIKKGTLLTIRGKLLQMGGSVALGDVKISPRLLAPIIEESCTESNTAITSKSVEKKFTNKTPEEITKEYSDLKPGEKIGFDSCYNTYYINCLVSLVSLNSYDKKLDDKISVLATYFKPNNTDSKDETSSKLVKKSIELLDENLRSVFVSGEVSKKGNEKLLRMHEGGKFEVVGRIDRISDRSLLLCDVEINYL